MPPLPPTPPSADDAPDTGNLDVRRFVVGRRRLLQWTGAVVGASTLGVSRASATTRSTAKPPPVPDPTTTAPADSLVEAMGARINVQLGNSAYGDLNAVRDAVAYIGLRYAREATVLPSVNPTMAGHQAQGWPMLAAVGCRIDTIMAKADGSEGSVAQLAAYHKSTYGGSNGGVLWGVENANEWNGVRGNGGGHGVSPVTGITYSDTYPLWAEQLAIWQRSTWRTYSADPQLAGLAVVGPALVNATPGNSAVLVDVANRVTGSTTGLQPYTTHSNYHVYCGQAAALSQPSVPSWHLDQKVAAMKVQAPSRPWVCTEAGMHNALDSTNTGFSPHSQTAAGLYAPRMTLEHLLRGTLRQWFFGLVDDQPDPNLNDQNNAFGLFNHDWTPKPAADATRRMASLFADPGPSFTPAQTSLTVSGDPSMMLHSLRFGKRDGTTLLALWRDVSVWDYVTQSDLAVPGQTATVTLANPATVQMYRPSVQDGVYANLGSGLTSLSVAVSGDVVVLSIV